MNKLTSIAAAITVAAFSSAASADSGSYTSAGGYSQSSSGTTYRGYDVGGYSRTTVDGGYTKAPDGTPVGNRTGSSTDKSLGVYVGKRF